MDIKKNHHWRQTHCKRAGHPLSGDNLHINTKGARVCKECARISSQWGRHKKSGDTSPFKPTPKRVWDAVATLWAGYRVNPDTNCWEWTGHKLPKGYGRIGKDGKLYQTHRLAYELARGPIPQGMHVCHHCDNPSCINPDHLFVGTNADNHADKIAKDRQAKPRGIKNAAAKLNEADVRAIRASA